MASKNTAYSGKLIERWVKFVLRNSTAVIILTALLCVATLFYLQHNFRINTDLNSMISDKLHFRQIEDDFTRAFPQLSDSIVIVLDGDTAERAVAARRTLAEELRGEPRLFKAVYDPAGGRFFEKNGLLYLSTEELQGLADKLANAQPLIAFLSQDLSLRGLFSVLEKVLSSPEFKEDRAGKMNLLFDEMSRTFEGAAGGRPYQMSWEAVMMGEKMAGEQRRQFIIVQPYLDIGRLSSDETSLDMIRRMARELHIDESTGVRMRITGDVALSYENLMTVRSSVGVATFVSLVLVGVAFFIGLGSGRMVLASLITLIAGLVLTTGFAIVSIGSVNLISITFAVLFIGLGIDYSIQFCLRYKELIWLGNGEHDSLRTTARGVGRSLLLSCVTVAIGFYSFLPTAYAGVAELGLISGTGMFISFFMTVTVLPALLKRLGASRKKGTLPSFGEILSNFPYRHSTALVVIAILSAVASIPLLTKVYFDYNPLDLYGKDAESVRTIRELFNNPESQPWTISALAKSRKEADQVAERLGSLKEVKAAVTVSDFVPKHQQEKLGIISDIALFMPPGLGSLPVKRLNYRQDLRALDGFESRVAASLVSPSMKDDMSLRRLYESVRRFKSFSADPLRGKTAFAELESGLLGGLPDLFKRLETSLQAREFSEADLPRQLVDQYVSADGRYRVQVFPSENILDVTALKRFVLSVQSVAPNATDSPVTIYESGRAVMSSFRQASLYALTAIILFLLVELRSVYNTVLILIPLTLAILLTGAASVLLDIPLNFANVIVVPLLLGIGVHSGIIFMLRYLNEPPEDGNMLRTSTARAVFFSILTTIISTGSLAFSPHRGIASMGVLLTICLSLLIICTLMWLPAFLEFFRIHRRTKIEENKGE